VTIYDDFAHHPTAIATTLDGLRKRVGEAPVIAVIEPRSNSMKLGAHRDGLPESVNDADQVIWYAPANLGWDLAATAAQCKVPSVVADSLEAIIERVKARLARHPCGDHEQRRLRRPARQAGRGAEVNGPERITLAMTGASGAQYGLRLLDCLVREDREVHFLISKAAQLVMATETDVAAGQAPGDAGLPHRVHRRRRWADPCVRQGRLDVAGGLGLRRAGGDGGGALFHRHVVGDCHRRLQQPDRARCRRHPQGASPVDPGAARSAVSSIHLENMLKLSNMGAVILPAAPGFYHQPQTIDDLVDFVVARILNLLNIPQDMLPRWGEHHLGAMIEAGWLGLLALAAGRLRHGAHAGCEQAGRAGGVCRTRLDLYAMNGGCCPLDHSVRGAGVSGAGPAGSALLDTLLLPLSLLTAAG
jgi:4-hydroxy-3-polyprenylbenzoate decarboxylase